jgi:hypothetical protein
LAIKVLFGPAEAFWGGMVFAVAPWFNDFAADVVRDPVFLFFFAWALYFGACAITRFRIRYFVFASCSWILALLCRIEAAVFLLAFLFVLIVLSVQDREKRFAYLKGIAMFFSAPAILFLIFNMLSENELVSFNRIGEISGYFHSFLNLDFLHSYRTIYEQMKVLEQTMPGWSWSRSFSEVTRHNLWLIYLVGLFQGIFKILFPLSALPCIVAFFRKKRLHKGHFYLMVLSVAYVMGAYFYYLKMNFIDSRYLMVPAILFLPWIGVGISLFFKWARTTARPRIASLVLLFIFVLIPLGESLEVVFKDDDIVVKEAGFWLARQSESNTFSMISNDSRIPFYSGHGMNYNHFPTRDYREMEQVAGNGDIDLLIIADAKKKITAPLLFEHYEEWNRLESTENVVFIYRKKS